jgi:hypothetical protein
MEKERKRYVYNPYLLNVIYQKLLYHDRLRHLHARRQRPTTLDNEERYRLVKENMRSEQVVADVFHTLDFMSRERFPFDIYHCNFEYVLMRFFYLLDPLATLASVTSLSADQSGNNNETLPVELKCLQVLDTWDQQQTIGGGSTSDSKGKGARDVILAVLDRYVARHYIQNIVTYERESVKRVSLLLNIKHAVEYRLKVRQDAELGGDAEYRIEYGGEVVVSMMYVFFANELLALLQEEAALLRTTYHTRPLATAPTPSLTLAQCDDDFTEYGARFKVLESHIALLEELYGVLQKHYTEEWHAFSLNMSVFPLLGKQQHTYGTASDNSDSPIHRYVKVAPDNAKTVLRYKDVEQDEFVIREKDGSHIRYIPLKKHRKLYEAAARRMMFDCALVRDHVASVCPVNNNGISGTQYTSCCQVCLYREEGDSLYNFYAASEAFTYYLCEYVLPSASGKRPESRQSLLAQHLDTMLVDPLIPLVSLLYKMGWQLQQLYPSLCRPGGDTTDDVALVANPFHVISVTNLWHYVIGQYEEYDHGPDARQDSVLRNARLHMKGRSAIAPWQKALALDIDVHVLMMHGIDVQQSEIEKFQRSLTLLSGDNIATHVASDIAKNLVRIYALYLSVLDGTMKSF